MKNLIVLFFAIMLTGLSTLDAQNSNKYSNNSERNTVVTTRPLSLVMKQPNIKIEHAFGSSFAAGSEFTWLTGLNSGIRVDPFIRLYAGRESDAPEGFYLQGKFSYGNHESETDNLVDQVETGDVIDTEDIIGQTSDRFNALGGGFGVGHQWYTGKNRNLAIDFYGGVRRYAAVGNTFSAETALFKATRGWPVELRFGIGYAF